jgi:hypothetical protein
MGVFGTEINDGVGMKICPPIETDGDTEFAAFGEPVPYARREQADNHLKEMGLTDAEERFDCIQKMSNAIERDEPMRAMNDCFKYLDVTGCYRLMAVLCTNNLST